jgi:type 1 fimbria pilin
MKLRNNLLAAALLAVAAPAAMAQSSSGDITIGGSIVPGSCNITLANGGVVDLGQINTSALSPGGNSQWPSQTVRADIVCSAPTTIAVTAFDNREASLNAGAVGNPDVFGLGLTDGATGNSIGYYIMRIPLASVDGASGAAMVKSSDLATWTIAAGGDWWQRNNVATHTRYRSFGNATSGPIPVTTAAFDLLVLPTIHSTAILALTKDAVIDGSSTIEITYI